MATKEIDSEDELNNVRDDWQDLYEKCPRVTPFQSPDWLLPWWRQFGKGDLLVLAAVQGRQLAGLAPLYVRSESSQSELIFLGTGISDYLDFICEPDMAGLIVPQLLEHVWNIRDRWNSCDLQELRQGSYIFEECSRSYLLSAVADMGVCPVLRLPPDEDAYLRSLPANVRRSIRQAAQKLAPYSVEQASLEDVAGVMESLFALHGKRWEGRNLPGVLHTPEIQEFHQEVASRFAARGALALYTLRSRDRVCAVLYGFRKAPRFYAYLSGFDPDLEDQSPGALLLCSVILDVLKAGFTEFDFLRGAEKYKYVWGAKDTMNYRLSFTREQT